MRFYTLCFGGAWLAPRCYVCRGGLLVSLLKLPPAFFPYLPLLVWVSVLGLPHRRDREGCASIQCWPAAKLFLILYCFTEKAIIYTADGGPVVSNHTPPRGVRG